MPYLQPAELFWVVKNGINMTAMPSFGAIGVGDQEIWSIVAFLRKLPIVSESRLQGLDVATRRAARRRQPLMTGIRRQKRVSPPVCVQDTGRNQGLRS